MKSVSLGWVGVMWVLPIAACAQEPVRLSKWGEIVIRQHVAGTPWFGLDVVTGGHTQSVPWVVGLHHQGWAAWQRHSLSAGQRMAVGALAADWLVHVGVDRWSQMRQTDPWVSVDARFSQVVKGSGRFTVDVGWHSQGGLERLLTWSTAWCPPNADGLLGCPQLIWSQQGQWGIRWNPRPTWLEDLRLWRRWSSGLQVFVGGPRWVLEMGWSWSPSSALSPLEDTTGFIDSPGRGKPRQHGWRVARGQRGVVTSHHMAWRWEE